ncbi:MAG TPA: glycosyltransferase, partial [Novosphingobium sp.]|nr:glycosyltransferase [Novosphingobium sp.]
GTLAGLRAIKNLPRLVRAFAGLPEPWQLVILGEGPEREAIRAAALRLDLAHRVHLPGFAADPAKVVGLFDLFALSSDSEQFPISVVEAMAAGLAVASPAVGDIAAMLAPANAPFVTPPGDEAALAGALDRLAADAPLRARIGADNRAKARAEYEEAAMVDRYAGIYARVMRREGFP